MTTPSEQKTKPTKEKEREKSVPESNSKLDQVNCAASAFESYEKKLWPALKKYHQRWR